MSRLTNVLYRYGYILIAIALSTVPLQSTNDCKLFDHAFTMHSNIDSAHQKALLSAERNAEEKTYQEAQESFKALLKKNPLRAQERVALNHYLHSLRLKSFGLPRLSANALELVSLIKQFRQRLGSLWEPFIKWAQHQLTQ